MVTGSKPHNILSWRVLLLCAASSALTVGGAWFVWWLS